MKLNLDWPLIRTALRTAGGTMIGNVFVFALLLGNRDWVMLGGLLLIGAVVIIVNSTKE